MEPWQTVDTRGAPKELEEMTSRAGMALMLEFFPALLRIDRARCRDVKEATFWEWMRARAREEDKLGYGWGSIILYCTNHQLTSIQDFAVTRRPCPKQCAPGMHPTITR